MLRLFLSFVCSFVRSKNFQVLVHVVAIDLVQKSSKSEPSSRIFRHLEMFDFWSRQQVLVSTGIGRRHYLAKGFSARRRNDVHVDASTQRHVDESVCRGVEAPRN